MPRTPTPLSPSLLSLATLLALLALMGCSGEQTERDLGTHWGDVLDAGSDAADASTADSTGACVAADCDDGIFCNGREYCASDGTCATAPAMNCDDGVACTTDICDESLRACRNVIEANACEGNAYCHPTEGCRPLPLCATAADCDDGVACTDDTCIDGRCQYVAFDVRCEGGDFCLTPERCAPFLGCLAGVRRNCDDGDACTSDRCDAAQGHCVYTLADEDADGYPDARCGGDDCDDSRALVHPMAVDLCNGVDDNCNVIIDEDEPFAGLSALPLGETRPAGTVWTAGANGQRGVLRLDQAGVDYTLTLELVDRQGLSLWAVPVELGTWSSAPEQVNLLALSPDESVFAVVAALPDAGGDHTLWVGHVDVAGTLTETTVATGVPGLLALTASSGTATHSLAIAWHEVRPSGPTTRLSVVDPTGSSVAAYDRLDVSPASYDPSAELAVAHTGAEDFALLWFDQTQQQVMRTDVQLGSATELPVAASSNAGSLRFVGSGRADLEVLWVDSSNTLVLVSGAAAPVPLFSSATAGTSITSIDEVHVVEHVGHVGVLLSVTTATGTEASYVSADASSSPIPLVGGVHGVDEAFDGAIIWALVIDETDALAWYASICR